MPVNGPLKESNRTTALKLFCGATSLPVELEQTLRGGVAWGWPQGPQSLHWAPTLESTGANRLPR